MKKSHHHPTLVVILTVLFLSPAALSSHHLDKKKKQKCVYTFYVRTGSIIRAGTDSRVSIAMGDSVGNPVWIPNLKHWGIMGPDHDYLERGSLDIFTGRGPCLRGPVCRLNVSSDGSGSHSSWFLNYVEVTATGPHMPCSQSIFHVDRWLSSDVPPYKLTAEIDKCEPKPTTTSNIN